MAELMPWACGVLTSLAVWFWEVGAAAGSAAHRDARRLRGEAERFVLGCAYGLGGRVPDALAGHGAFAACATEAGALGAHALRRASVDAQTAAGMLVLGAAAGGVAGAVVAASPLGALVGCCAPIAFVAIRASRARAARERLIETAMPEAFHGLSISLGSGHSLAQALRFVGNHAREPVRTEFLRASCELACGIAASDALDGLLRRLPAPGLDLVALALKVSQRTGAPLGELLAQASGMVGERIELARHLEVKTAQARLSARLVAAMPLAMIAVLMLLSPDFRAGLATPVGAGSVGVALALNAVAFVLIRRIMGVKL